MMSQEEFMDVLAMRRQGMSFVEIGDENGSHPATISKWLREGGPPPARTVAEQDRVVDRRWADRLNELLLGNQHLLATSLFEIIPVEGFDGSSIGGPLGARKACQAGDAKRKGEVERPSVTSLSRSSTSSSSPGSRPISTVQRPGPGLAGRAGA
jgi:hypothetical protein